MDLWIRSQDKTKLMKANEIEICQNPTGTWWFNVEQCIGEYKTKERALEVLDEIQDLDIDSNSNIKVNCYAYSLIRIIYEMPRE